MDCVCLLCAIFFFISNLLNIASRVRDSKNTFFSEEEYKLLDPNFLDDLWDYRSSGRALVITSGLMNALAWFTLCVPVVQVAYILSMGGTRKLGLHILIAALAMGGSIAELISRFMMVGMTGAAEWIQGNFNMESWEGFDSGDGIGYRVLEMIHLMTSGLILWIDAFEWLALFGILLLIFLSVRTTSSMDAKFGVKWALLGLLIGILCISDFIADVLKFVDAPLFTNIAIFISVVNMMFLFPFWLLLLGVQLPSARPNAGEEDDFVNGTNTMPNSKMGRMADAFNRTIDEVDKALPDELL